MMCVECNKCVFEGGPVLQAFPRHSLSEAALATSGAPIFLLDSFTQVQALSSTRTRTFPVAAVACPEVLQMWVQSLGER